VGVHPGLAFGGQDGCYEDARHGATSRWGTTASTHVPPIIALPAVEAVQAAGCRELCSEAIVFALGDSPIAEKRPADQVRYLLAARFGLATNPLSIGAEAALLLSVSGWWVAPHFEQ